MTWTSPNGSKQISQDSHGEETAVIERIKQKARRQRLRTANSLAARMQIAPDGTKTFIRFTSIQRLEHQILILTFTLLAITGLLQRYSSLSLVGWIINTIFGGVETLRTLHHLTAVLFILQSLYHLAEILIVWFVKRERGTMWPTWQDFRDIVQTLKYNLGRTETRPAYGRFSVEEKIEYWALLWGTMIMIITGLIQWFPTWITLILPGVTIPIARAIHGWEAVLATLSILIWHLYHTVIKEKNKSIFTGVMTEHELMETHILEYRRILAAYDYLNQLAKEKAEKENKEQAPSPVAKTDIGYELVQKTSGIEETS